MLLKHSEIPVPAHLKPQTSPKRDALANLTPKLKQHNTPNMISIPARNFPTATLQLVQPQPQATV
jgi:hypothetical protein